MRRQRQQPSPVLDVLWIDAEETRRIGHKRDARVGAAKKVRHELRIHLGLFSVARSSERESDGGNGGTDAVALVSRVLTSLAQNTLELTTVRGSVTGNEVEVPPGPGVLATLTGGA